MAREFRRAKSMNVPMNALRQEELGRMLSPPGGRMPLTPKQAKREHPAASLSRSNSNPGRAGFGERLRSGSKPNLFPAASPRADPEAGRYCEASMLPPLGHPSAPLGPLGPPLGDAKGGRKPPVRSERRSMTWTPSAETEAVPAVPTLAAMGEAEHHRSPSSTTTCTPSPKSKSSSSQASDTAACRTPPSTASVRLEVPSHLYDEGTPSPAASGVRHRSAAAAILERFSQVSARGPKERRPPGEHLRQPQAERWPQEASPRVAARQRDSADRPAEAPAKGGKEREAGSKRPSLVGLERPDSSAASAVGASKRPSLAGFDLGEPQEALMEPHGSTDPRAGQPGAPKERAPSSPMSGLACSRRRSKLAVPGCLPLDRLQLLAAQERAAADSGEGGSEEQWSDPQRSGRGKAAPLNRSSTWSSLPAATSGDEPLPVSSRNRGIWRMGLSGRRRPSPRPPEELLPQKPLKDIRELTDEKIYDLYCWDEVLQEAGDGGKVVICRLKNSPEDSFRYVMKIRSKESLRKQMHEEEFRKSQVRMLNFPPHRGIMCPRDVMEDDKFYYIVMDRAMGGSFLGSLVKEFKDGKMPQDAVKRVMREIFEAVHHIHKHRMLHRDIKPDNLVMQLFDDPEGGGSKTTRAVALIDFDHADSDWSPGSCSADHSCYGTMRFNAPETLHGEYSASSDLYSVGGILYLLMTGKMPHSDSLFEEETDCEDQGDGRPRSRSGWMEQLYAQLRDDPIDWDCNPWPDNPECRDFCATLLAFHPLERFPSAEGALRHGWLAA